MVSSIARASSSHVKRFTERVGPTTEPVFSPSVIGGVPSGGLAAASSPSPADVEQQC